MLGRWVDFVAISVFFPDRYWTLQSGSSIQGHRHLKNEIWSAFCKIQNKAAVWFWEWYNLANIQSPVSNVAVDDHTESGFLWPICLQCCNNCDVKFLDQFLQNSQQNGRWKSGGCFLFSISHYTKQPAEWKMEIWWLLSIFHISGTSFTLW